LLPAIEWVGSARSPDRNRRTVSGVPSVEVGLRLFALALFCIVSALVLALPAAAKEGVKAELTTSIPLDAPAGTELKVGWRLFSVNDEGQQEAFGANGVYVRLLSASGADAEEGVAPVGAHPTGQYEATVTVPEGGIRDVQVALMGWRSDANGTRRADVLFPITNDPVPTPAPVSSATSGQAASEDPQSGWRIWPSIVAMGAAAVLALLAAALVRHRKRPSALSPRRG
jgi:hypothetical protein